jgi:hypothetical protein
MKKNRLDKIPTLKQARQVALQGKAEEAIPALRFYADRGDVSAAASLAELLAFKYEWNECLQRAGELIVHPNSVYTGNIFDDMVYLLARAGQETNQWGSLLRITQTAAERVEENIADFPPSKQESARKRYGKIFQALGEYAQSERKFPFELTRIFGVTSPTQTETAQDRTRKEAEAILLYEGGQLPTRFEFAVLVAKAYVQRELLDRAWNILWEHAKLWWPVDRAQVAPVVLLVDSDLARVMNRERGEMILHLPRGPEARR